MGLFWRKKADTPVNEVTSIHAVCKGTLKDIATVSDPVFAQKMLGEAVAIEVSDDKATLVAPSNGVLSVLFPTGHAYGLTLQDGTELLVHIGIETVQNEGVGFKVLKKQGDTVKQKDAIVEVDFALLKQKYEMPVMIIITKQPDGKELHFVTEGSVTTESNIIA